MKKKLIYIGIISSIIYITNQIINYENNQKYFNYKFINANGKTQLRTLDKTSNSILKMNIIGNKLDKINKTYK